MQGLGYKFVEQSGRYEKRRGCLEETKGRGVITRRSCQCPKAKPRGCIFCFCVGDPWQFSMDVLKRNLIKGPATSEMVLSLPRLL